VVFVLDNYDSFTYNLVQYLGEMGETIEVRRNDHISLARAPHRTRASASI